MHQRSPAASPALPTMYDLPSEDPQEPGLPDEFHDLQPQLLSRTLRLSQYSSSEIYTASDLNLYYDAEHTNWYKRPDWFLVVGVPRLYDGKGDRSSYVIWQEKVSPIVVVEFLSPGTDTDDLGRFAPKPLALTLSDAPPLKFVVYEQILKVPHYVVYDKRDNHLRYFRLVNGAYQEQAIATTNPRLWIPELAIGLGLWEGEFEGLPKVWLRWCDAIGTFFPTDTEAERSDKEEALWQREQAQQQLQQTALNLLGMGMSIAQVAQVTGLPENEVQAMTQSNA
jgi:Uma2 family endonuclease